MVLYLLRHEIRLKERVDFYTPLGMTGKYRSKTKLFRDLDKLQIDEIYCSPYKRTLDTIDTLSRLKNIPIKIDWALAEFLNIYDQEQNRDNKFPDIGEQTKLHDNYNIDKSYKPTTTHEYVNSYIESYDSFKKRVENFTNLVNLMKSQNILIVTHGAVCNYMSELLVGYRRDFQMGECLKLDFSPIRAHESIDHTSS